MAKPRSSQFCAVARALDILAERWTLLIIRELILGPKRFSDLRIRLDEVSPSVLAGRLGRMEALGLVRRSTLAPPAASNVYELTETGRALEPALIELGRWGARFLYPRRSGDRFEPDWALFSLRARARAKGSPEGAIQIRLREGKKEAALHVAGGRHGTIVTLQDAAADATVRLDVETLLAAVRGSLPMAKALASGRAEGSGSRRLLLALPKFFTPPPAR